MGKCTTLNATSDQIAAAVGVIGPGDIYYVDYRNGSDLSNGKSWKDAFKTLSAAINAVTTNNNDIILIDGDSTVVETAMVSLTKSRVHIFGVNGNLGLYGQGAKVQVGVTTDTDDIATFQNTGVRNTITGVKFINSNTLAQALYSVAEGGEYTRYHNCEFYKDTILDSNTAAELLMNGDSCQLYKCTIGSTANLTGGTRANILVTAVLSGKKCRDFYAEECILWGKADDTDKHFVYGANATDVERMFMMKDCTFYNTKLATGVPAHAVGFGAAQTQGSVILKDCASVNCTIMAEAAVGIYVAGAVPTFATTGVAKAS